MAEIELADIEDTYVRPDSLVHPNDDSQDEELVEGEDGIKKKTTWYEKLMVFKPLGRE